MLLVARAIDLRKLEHVDQLEDHHAHRADKQLLLTEGVLATSGNAHPSKLRTQTSPQEIAEKQGEQGAASQVENVAVRDAVDLHGTHDQATAQRKARQNNNGGEEKGEDVATEVEAASTEGHQQQETNGTIHRESQREALL